MTTETNSPQTAKSNPSVPTTKPKPEEVKQARKRVPMSVPISKLAMPDLPGWHLHWFKELNVARALQAAYEFVDADELPNGMVIAGSVSGNADLGSRIRVHAGVNEHSGPEYLILMKLKEEYWLEDRKAIDEAAAVRMSGIFRGEAILDSPDHRVESDDRALRYVKTALMNRPVRKVKTAT
jgi:hypothetical protein